MRGINQTGVTPEARTAAYRLMGTPRWELLVALEQHPDCAWLRRAMEPSTPARVVMLGLFWIKMGKGLWPGVAFHVTWQGRTRTTVLYSPPGAGWKTSTRLTDAVHWPQWAGRAEGEAGVVNGDVPSAGAPASSAAAHAGS